MTQPKDKTGARASGARMRTIRLPGRRTTVRLEPVFWDALDAVAHREGISPNDVCVAVFDRIGGEGLTPALRMFLTAYAWSLSFETALQTARTGTVPETLTQSGFC